jgi:hypothetical protein
VPLFASPLGVLCAFGVSTKVFSIHNDGYSKYLWASLATFFVYVAASFLFERDKEHELKEKKRLEIERGKQEFFRLAQEGWLRRKKEQRAREALLQRKRLEQEALYETLYKAEKIKMRQSNSESIFLECYTDLELNKDASEEAIRKNFKKVALKHHPDKGGDQEIFKKIQRAYGLLKNQCKRAWYDQHYVRFCALEKSGGGGTLASFIQLLNEYKKFVDAG